MNLDMKQISKIIKNFSGKDDVGNNRSLVALETMSLNNETGEQSTLAMYASVMSFNDIKVVEGRIMLDINFDNAESEDCLALIDNVELYRLLLTQTVEPIINKITLVLNDEFKSEQIAFINPMYFNKFSNRAGKKINGVRLLYEPHNVVYIPEFLQFESDEEIKEMAEKEGMPIELEG